MANHPTRFASWHRISTLEAARNGFCRWLAGLFVSTAPPLAAERERAHHWLLLAALLGIGAFARFWGLGSTGLHGDEETMAMAVMHILEDGTPLLPSGMFYPRGLTQLYLMALSVLAFGESEWALRLPSALCGVALIALAYLAARRFVRPNWSLALAASVALLPELIAYSQTARMYIFMLASIAAAMICIFAWERSGRLGWLAGAIAAMIFGIDFQPLTVTAVLLLLLPGLLQADLRKVTYGLAAIAAVMVFYLALDAWVNEQYPVPPAEYAADLGTPHWLRTPDTAPFARSFQVALWVAGLAVAFFAMRVGRTLWGSAMAVTVTVMLLAVVLGQLYLMYHAAALLAIAAFVVARRHGSPGTENQLLIFGLGGAVIALIQGTLLAARPGSVIQVVGAMVGQPSVWPYVRIAEFSMLAALMAGAGVVWSLWRLSSRRAAPDYGLLAALGVWIPLLAIGLFLWNMPSRYLAASLLPMLICGFAATQAGFDWLRRRYPALLVPRVASTALLALLAVVIANPFAVARVLNSGYSNRPDHKGAAEYLRSQGVAAEDVVIAEDVLQQTYYLGDVDYWLISRKYARRYVERVSGMVLDFYTHTPVISSKAELEEALARERGRRIFIVGSGENQRDRRRDMRGDMFELLDSDAYPVVYRGRDGWTRVWRVDSPGAHQDARPGTAALPTAAEAVAPE